jgi:hypothetical protein
VRDVQPGHVWEDQRRVRYYRREDFDRVRYALRVIDTLRPPRVNVLVREGIGEVRIDRGHQWDMPSGYTWAMVSVPPQATREEIAMALIELDLPPTRESPRRRSTRPSWRSRRC